MQPNKSLRIGMCGLKAELMKKVGLERFKKYFYVLNRFLNRNLSKSDFDKSCYRILGRETLPLHNQIIRVILRNVCSAKAPPPPPDRGICLVKHSQSSVTPIWSNEVVSPLSPRKNRSGMHDSGEKTIGKGDLAPQYTKQPESEKRKLLKKTSKVEDGEEVEQASRLKLSESPMLAPLGIPFCSASIGGARKALHVTQNCDYAAFFDNEGFYDNETLRRRMEHIAAVQGLGGVTLECANTVNNMLDVYLKRLIRSSVQLVGQKEKICVKTINGQVDDRRVHNPISLLAFKTAMELNPQQLGEDWPAILEKLSMQAFEEQGIR